VNRSKSFALFVLFLICFCFALTLKFEYFIVERDESHKIYILLILFGLSSGVFLGLSLRALNHTKGLFRALSEGMGMALVALLGVSLTESLLSEQSYLKTNRPENFSVLSGHCGVYAGRTVLKILHAEEASPQDGAIREFEIKDRCRIAHLDYLMKHQVSLCDSAEDAIDCRIRWMSGIAEHGYWNHATRKFFFNQVMQAWPESKKEEALVAYTQKDQELELGRQSILKQAGIEETLNDKLLLVQEKEELENLMLTRDIFNSVDPMLTDAKSSPPPYLFKFKDLQTEVLAKLTKIPELEKEIEQLETNAKVH